MLSETLVASRFPNACVASPHHLASSAGLEVFARGGNALDAAIATNLTLAVVMPYACGFGGDLFAMVWDERFGSTATHGYNGSGRAPAAATLDAVRARSTIDAMPRLGPLPVTVPGAVEAWFTLLDRFGTREFGDLAQRARAYATGGFDPGARGAATMRAPAESFAGEAEWNAVYGGARAGEAFRQAGLARTLDALCAEGPAAYYRGPIARAIVECLVARGGLMREEDLAEHTGDWVTPLRARYRGLEVLEMPPNTQGVTALEALRVYEGLSATESESVDRHHQMIESMKYALADREEVTDAALMRARPTDMIGDAWVGSRRARVGLYHATTPPRARPTLGGTAYICAADSSMSVSLIQSNYAGFGSGITVPGWGINLHNRGAYFSLDPEHANVIAPRKRTMHTLIPAMVLREGRPWLVFGTMGADGQAQTHLQLLSRIIDDGLDVAAAIDAPRWIVSPADWSVTVESRFGAPFIDGLRARGHVVSVGGAYDSLLGHAHAIEHVPGGFAIAADRRCEGAALGM